MTDGQWARTREKRIKQRIADIAQRRNNVTLQEIESVVRMLGRFHDTNVRPATHGCLFRVGDQKFMVSGHTPGHKQVKKYAVDAFLAAMAELGWFE